MSVGFRGAEPSSRAFFTHAQDVASSHRLIQGVVREARMDSERVILHAISCIRSLVDDVSSMRPHLCRVVCRVPDDPAFRNLYSVFFRTLAPFSKPLCDMFDRAEQLHYMTLAYRTGSLETFCKALENVAHRLTDPGLIGIVLRFKRLLEPAQDPIEYVSLLSQQSICPIHIYLYVLEVGAQPVILDDLIRRTIDRLPIGAAHKRCFFLWQIYSEIYKDLDPAECHRRYAIMTDFFEGRGKSYAYASWARFAYKKGEKERACDIYNQALCSVDPVYHQKIHLFLAFLYAEMRDVIRSRAHAQKAIEHISIHNIHTTILTIAYGFQHLGFSTELLIAFLDESSNATWDLHFACIVFEMRAGRLARARELSVEYLERYPQNHKIQSLWLFLHKNVVPESMWLEKCAEFLSITPSSVELLTEYALYLLREDNIKEALFYAEMSIKRKRKYGDALIVYLYCLVRTHAPEDRYRRFLSELMPLRFSDIHAVFCYGFLWDAFHLLPGMTIHDTFRLIRRYFEEHQDFNLGFFIPDVSLEPVDLFKATFTRM